MQQKVLKLGMRSNSAAAIESSSPLQRAALENKPSVVSELIKEGANINEKFAKGWTALHIGSAHNYRNVVGVLLEHNADPELGLPNSSTALHIASTNGHHKVMEVLLCHRARLDVK
ncbi:ankyrin repeat domain-containing protein [Aspergillus chevalieri]|uniref:Ankyrin repeat protein n=1 Tax=Aspergillus chevalieri TaxID=182096 RepID=A0A7R7ZPD5_ASPCH|nr:uncharacterized protein ACHE_40796A [Aspergillus chevalieri]BCR88232.1 hypothetical protein ACHE_40796A [Aspergillus chevalieri]